MRVNPLADVGEFLTQGGFMTVVFWLLIAASIAIAAAAWLRSDANRAPVLLGDYAVRFVAGSMWWQQSLWKLPPYYTDQPKEPFGTTGLAYWMGEMTKWSAFPIQGRLVKDVVLANFYLFAPFVYAAEVFIGVSLMLGVFSRLGAFIGAAMAINLWLGLYRAPSEWPWTYGFLVIIQLIYLLHPPGRSLGLDALWRARDRGDASLWSRLIRIAT